MAISAGSRIGHYTIVGPLGAGGMGEVWRARDPHLERDVAIKAIPESYAKDAERLARFEREGRLLASLRHANIAGVHAVVEQDGARYLALEIVEGETLAARLERGPLPLEDALEVAIQVASALEAAHEAGVIHRDLKPGNIMLRPDGTAVVLDFGLARGAEGSSNQSELTQSPTITSPATMPGTILGTAAYMAPEQARGRMVDRRADIWAFGCVLYEMLTGARPFAGETLTDTVAAILKGEPDWAELPPATPPRLRALLARCLRKDPRERLRDIGDARLELNELRADRGEAPAPAAARAPRWTTATPWALAALAIAAATWLALGRAPASQGVQRTTLLPDPGTQIELDPATFAISPDGRRVVFVATDSTGRRGLWVREAGSLSPRRLCDIGLLPFWSPDGSQIAFFDKAALWRVRIADGIPERVCDSGFIRGGAWTPRDELLFSPGPVGGLVIVPASGGEPRDATVLDTTRNESLHRFPVMLPDGKHFLFAALPAPEGKCAICVGELGSATHRFLFYAESAVRYVAPGWLLWSRNDRLVAQRFDARTLQRKGEPIVLPDLPSGGSDVSLLPYADASQRGDLAYLSQPSSDFDLAELDRAGRERRRVQLPPGQFLYPAVSPRGDQVAIENLSQGERASIWIVDLARGGALNLTPEAKLSSNACWSNDGSRIAYTRRDSTGQSIVIRGVDGSAPEVVVGRVSSLFAAATDWSRDDRSLILMLRTPATRADLFIMPVAGDGAIRPYRDTPMGEGFGKFSPDDRWVVYGGGQSGRGGAYVQAYPTPGALIKVSGDVSMSPASSRDRESIWWSDSGGELLLFSSDRTIWSVPVSTSAGFEAGAPVRLFKAPAMTHSLAPSRDGQRFYAIVPRGGAQPPTITLVRGWTEDLKR